ncbi:ABC transporter permease [Numidum massiliense]|uniref:ABC transporter permease n=1 Tax=Numidum massiliense TaxID=1522315 RepID=UPI0006D59D72|nr:ABC transporter permease [Numidum massiliense]
MTGHVYYKEMVDTMRDRKTLLLSIMFPIMFMVGLIFLFEFVMFADSTDQIKVAVSKGNTPVHEWLKESDKFRVTAVSDPVQRVKDGEAAIAVKVPSNFAKKMAANETPEIATVIDPGSQKGNEAAELLGSYFAGKKQTLIYERLAANNIDVKTIEPFQLAQKNIGGEEEHASLMMLGMFAQMVIVFAVLMGGMPAANDLFAGEKERKTMEALLMTPVKRLHLIVGKWLAIATLGIISGIFSVVTLIVSVTFFTEKLSAALKLDDSLFPFIGTLLIGIVALAFLLASIEMIASLAANTMKEAQNYIAPISMLVMVPYFLLINTSVNELATYHFLIPVMNVCALIKQLIFGVYDVTSVVYVVASSLVFIGLTFGIAYAMFKKGKWVLGKS